MVTRQIKQSGGKCHGECDGKWREGSELELLGSHSPFERLAWDLILQQNAARGIDAFRDGVIDDETWHCARALASSELPIIVRPETARVGLVSLQAKHVVGNCSHGPYLLLSLPCKSMPCHLRAFHLCLTNVPIPN